eukprot:TRINITY_DN2191_c0_g1_i2.p1 TRINITY_DN2191_c0_g1~~TRINITY_DN2191_c0_g1_i2.p1  ORF type:complete len:125 (+),score=10.89 TRINITY_DN2191_c0_g1_i2:47-421(+)
MQRSRTRYSLPLTKPIIGSEKNITPSKTFGGRRREGFKRRFQRKKFFDQTKKKAFSGLKLEVLPTEAAMLMDESRDTIDVSKAPYYGFDPNSMTLYLKAVPVNISRWDILNIVKKTSRITKWQN